MAEKNFFEKYKPKYYAGYILIGGILIYAFIMQSIGKLPKSQSQLMVQAAYSIILAVSLNLVVGFLGELSLGHAGFMCIGAYAGSYIAIQLSDFIHSKLAVLIISMLAGGLLASAFGFLVGLPALRLKGDYLAIVTLAFGEIVRTVIKNLPFFGGALGLNTNKIKYDTRSDASLYIAAFTAALLTVFFIQNLVRSKHGRAITAIRDNETAARAMGINVTFYKLFVFVFSAFFAGAAGVIYGHCTTPVEYSVFSYNYSIEILVMVVLGGMASINGSITAAALITVINIQLQKMLTGNLAALKFLVYALILIVTVIFNNAPGLEPLRAKLSLKNLTAAFSGKKHTAGGCAESSPAPADIREEKVLTAASRQSREAQDDTQGKGGIRDV